MLRIPRFLNMRLIGRAEAVRIKHRLALLSRPFYIYILLVLISVRFIANPMGLLLVEELGKLVQFNYLVGF
jgi:hypothetical protein